MSTATFETDADKWRALAFALLLHVFVVAALFAGLMWQREPAPTVAAEGAIEATLMTAPSAARALQTVATTAEQAPRDATPPPQPKPEPAPQTAQTALQPKPQKAQDQPDKVDQQRVSALALQAAEQQKKAQEEKHRQDQILLQQQAQDQAENKQRLAALAVLQSERAKAERNTRLAEQKLKQLQDQSAHLTEPAAPAPIGPVRAPVGSKGDDLAGLLARYHIALNHAANTNWDHVGVPAGVHCQIVFTQIPGGEVIGELSYQNCPFDAVARETIERAMRKQPMPYTGFERVFSRQARIDFCYPEEACAK